MKITNKSQIGQAIKKARKIGKAKLAKQLNVHKDTISQVENDEVDYRVGTLLKICEAVDLEIEIKPKK